MTAILSSCFIDTGNPHGPKADESKKPKPGYLSVTLVSRSNPAELSSFAFQVKAIELVNATGATNQLAQFDEPLGAELVSGQPQPLLEKTEVEAGNHTQFTFRLDKDKPFRAASLNGTELDTPGNNFDVLTLEYGLTIEPDEVNHVIIAIDEQVNLKNDLLVNTEKNTATFDKSAALTGTVTDPTITTLCGYLSTRLISQKELSEIPQPSIPPDFPVPSGIDPENLPSLPTDPPELPEGTELPDADTT